MSIILLRGYVVFVSGGVFFSTVRMASGRCLGFGELKGSGTFLNSWRRSRCALLVSFQRFSGVKAHCQCQAGGPMAGLRSRVFGWLAQPGSVGLAPPFPMDTGVGTPASGLRWGKPHPTAARWRWTARDAGARPEWFSSRTVNIHWCQSHGPKYVSMQPMQSFQSAWSIQALQVGDSSDVRKYVFSRNYFA